MNYQEKNFASDLLFQGNTEQDYLLKNLEHFSF